VLRFRADDVRTALIADCGVSPGSAVEAAYLPKYWRVGKPAISGGPFVNNDSITPGDPGALRAALAVARRRHPGVRAGMCRRGPSPVAWRSVSRSTVEEE
jgi:hypothetical protein